MRCQGLGSPIRTLPDPALPSCRRKSCWCCDLPVVSSPSCGYSAHTPTRKGLVQAVVACRTCGAACVCGWWWGRRRRISQGTCPPSTPHSARTTSMHATLTEPTMQPHNTTYRDRTLVLRPYGEEPWRHQPLRHAFARRLGDEEAASVPAVGNLPVPFIFP